MNTQEKMTIILKNKQSTAIESVKAKRDSFLKDMDSAKNQKEKNEIMMKQIVELYGYIESLIKGGI